MFVCICLSPASGEQWGNVNCTGMRGTSGWGESTIHGTNGSCPRHVCNSPHMQIYEHLTGKGQGMSARMLPGHYWSFLVNFHLISYRQIIKICGLVQLVDCLADGKVTCFKRRCFLDNIIRHVRSKPVTCSSELSLKQEN